MLGGPDDAVEDEDPQVVVLPVLVEVGEGDADAPAGIRPLDTPGDDFLFGILGRKQGRGHREGSGNHPVAVGAEVDIGVGLVVEDHGVPTPGGRVAGVGGLDAGGFENLGLRLVMLAARGEVAAHPVEQRVVAVPGDVLVEEANPEMQADDPAAFAHCLRELGHGLVGIGQPFAGEVVAEEDEGVVSVEGLGDFAPGVDDVGLDGEVAVVVLEAVRDEASAGLHLVAARWVVGGADYDQDLGGAVVTGGAAGEEQDQQQGEGKGFRVRAHWRRVARDDRCNQSRHKV